MWLYILIMIFALMCIGNQNLARSKSFLAYSLLLLALFVGCSDMLGGYDRYLYAELFDGIHDLRVKSSILAVGYFQSEHGYVVTNYLISFLTANRYIFILIYTMLIYFVMYMSFKDYMENYPIAIVLFLAMMFFFTFTYLRQVMAVMISWYSLRYIYKRNLLKFLACVLLAITFHNSAVILLPMYFVPAVKFNPKTVKIVMTALLILGLSPLPGALYSAFGDLAGTEERINQYTADYNALAGGFRIDYIIEAVFFLYIILKNYDVLPTDKKSIVLQNTAIVFCGILLLFVRSSTGGRLSWYYMAGVIAAMSSIMVHTRMPNLRTCMNIVCFLLYLRIVLGWGTLLSPYKTFFTDGHREDDYIFQRFEYDRNYDRDKFYR